MGGTDCPPPRAGPGLSSPHSPELGPLRPPPRRALGAEPEAALVPGATSAAAAGTGRGAGQRSPWEGGPRQSRGWEQHLPPAAQPGLGRAEASRGAGDRGGSWWGPVGLSLGALAASAVQLLQPHSTAGSHTAGSHTAGPARGCNVPQDPMCPHGSWGAEEAPLPVPGNGAAPGEGGSAGAAPTSGCRPVLPARAALPAGAACNAGLPGSSRLNPRGRGSRFCSQPRLPPQEGLGAEPPAQGPTGVPSGSQPSSPTWGQAVPRGGWFCERGDGHPAPPPQDTALCRAEHPGVGAEPWVTVLGARTQRC